jgi:hypothetical protein
VQQTRFQSAAAEAWVSLIVAADYLTQQSEAVCARNGTRCHW